MKKIVGFAAALMVGACATGAQKEMARLESVAAAGTKADDACAAQVETTAAYAIVRDKLGWGSGPTLANQADTSKPTPNEVQALYAVHAAYMPCRKGRLETAANINPALVPPLVERYAGQDAVLVDLVNQRETWGGAARRIAAVDAQTGAKGMAVGSQIMGGLNQSHQAELRRRQTAAAAMSQWVANQQIISAMNQPRYTNCMYVGTQLSCVSQ